MNQVTARDDCTRGQYEVYSTKLGHFFPHLVLNNLFEMKMKAFQQKKKRTNALSKLMKINNKKKIQVKIKIKTISKGRSKKLTC